MDNKRKINVALIRYLSNASFHGSMALFSRKIKQQNPEQNISTHHTCVWYLFDPLIFTGK